MPSLQTIYRHVRLFHLAEKISALCYFQVTVSGSYQFLQFRLSARIAYAVIRNFYPT